MEHRVIVYTVNVYVYIFIYMYTWNDWKSGIFCGRKGHNCWSLQIKKVNHGFQVPAQHVKSNGKSQEQSPLSISQLGILKPVMLSWDKLCAAALAVRPWVILAPLIIFYCLNSLDPTSNFEVYPWHPMMQYVCLNHFKSPSVLHF